jgi:hypothetical protein
MKNLIITLVFAFIFSNSLYSQMQPPILMFPPNGAINVSTTTVLLWIGGTGALKYRVQLSTNSGFILPLTIDTVIITGYQVPPGRLSYLTQYFWRVNAINNLDTSAWSVIWHFTTAPPPLPAPTLIAPPNGSTGISLTPLLDWGDVLTAQSYEIQLSTNSSFISLVVDTEGVAASEVTIPEGFLLNNTLYYWRVHAVNQWGISPWSIPWSFTTCLTGLMNYGNEIPKEFILSQNYPNPFNPSTKIKFGLPAQSYAFDVLLVIYDNLGKQFLKLIENELKPGEYEFTLDASGYSSGVYFYKLTVFGNGSNPEGFFTDTKKMIMVK